MPSPLIKHLSKSTEQFDNDTGGIVPVIASFKRAATAQDSILSACVAINANPDLNDAGRKKAALEAVKKNAREILTLRKSIDQFTTVLAVKRGALQPPAPDKADFAAAFVRGQIRDRYAKMPSPEERKIAALNDDDALTMQALLEGPASLSGIDSATRDALRDKLIGATHPKQLAEIQRAESAVQIARFAVIDLIETAAATAEVHKDEFGKFLDEIVPDQRAVIAEATLVAQPLAN